MQINQYFTFEQYLAFVLGVCILLTGFWLMLFLVNTVLYWAFGGTIDLIKEKKEKKALENKES